MAYGTILMIIKYYHQLLIIAVINSKYFRYNSTMAIANAAKALVSGADLPSWAYSLEHFSHQLRLGLKNHEKHCGEIGRYNAGVWHPDGFHLPPPV